MISGRCQTATLSCIYSSFNYKRLINKLNAFIKTPTVSPLCQFSGAQCSPRSDPRSSLPSACAKCPVWQQRRRSVQAEKQWMSEGENFASWWHVLLPHPPGTRRIILLTWRAFIRSISSVTVGVYKKKRFLRKGKQWELLKKIKNKH